MNNYDVLFFYNYCICLAGSHHVVARVLNRVHIHFVHTTEIEDFCVFKTQS